MSASLDTLSAQLTALIGPDAFAKHAAAVSAAQAAAAAHAAAVAQAAAAAKAAAAAAPKPAAAASAAAPKPAAPTTPTVPVAPVAAPAPKPISPAPAPVTSTAPATPAARPAAAAATAVPARPAAAAAPAAPARPAAPPAPPPPPPAPLQKTDHAAVGYDLDATVAPSQVIAAARLVDAQGFALDSITGVDWLAQNQMEVVYDYFHPTESQRIVVRTRVARATPEVPSIVEIFPGANWHERETHDFFGITFTGHPNLKPFLLPEDAQFHPLRKDYAP